MKEFFNRKIEELREHTNVFDVKAMLIKPIQRILKYPLLLNELSKVCFKVAHFKSEYRSVVQWCKHPPGEQSRL